MFVAILTRELHNEDLTAAAKSETGLHFSQNRFAFAAHAGEKVAIEDFDGAEIITAVSWKAA